MHTANTIDVTDAIEQAPFGRLQILIVALCAWVALLDGFDTQAIAYVAPVIAEQWHIEMAGFGPIFGAGLAGLTVGAFILSPAADRFGRKKIILLSVLLFGIFALVTAKATSLNELLIYRFLTGLGTRGRHAKHHIAHERICPRPYTRHANCGDVLRVSSGIGFRRCD